MSALKSLASLCYALVFLLALGWAAKAADLSDVKVEKKGRRYHLTSVTYFNATQSQIYKILTDYEQFTRFSSAFVESENREPDEQGRPRYYTRLEGCVLFFCKSYIRYGHLELKPDHDIVAISDPEQGNFKFSRERWHLSPNGEGTILKYEFEMEPGFWVPPLVGPFVIKRALRSGGADAVDRIEALALGKEPEK